MENRLQKLEIEHAVNREKFDNLMNKVADMPTKDETKLMFVEETRKLIGGMGGRINKLESNQKWIIGIGGAVGSLLGKFWDRIF